jgi:hypothetical protein
MTSYDAAFRGLKTLLLCPTLAKGKKNSNYFRDLINDGFAELGNMKSEEIIRWIHFLEKKKIPFSFKTGGKMDLLEALGVGPDLSGA